MKITTIKYTERKNLGNYEHMELSAEAILDESDNVGLATQNLISFVKSSLNDDFPLPDAPQEVAGHTVAYDEETKSNVLMEEPKKEKKARAKKEKAPVSDETSNIPAIPVEEVKPVGKNVEVYNSNIAEHKSIFAGYLAKKYDNSWKTAKPVDEIKSFTASLNGKHFLDNDGKIVESFLNLVHEFFGA